MCSDFNLKHQSSLKRTFHVEHFVVNCSVDLNDVALRVDFTAMQLTTVEHSFLFIFALLTYCKLELSVFFRNNLELHWIIVFSPLFALSIASIGLVVWAMRRDK
ncbi:hypothetical protein COOONC_14355, partial [Cooperia oncophora]